VRHNRTPHTDLQINSRGCPISQLTAAPRSPSARPAWRCRD